MLPDIDLLTDLDLGLYLLEHVNEIRQVSGRHGLAVSKKAIAIVLGVYHDDRSRGSLYRRLNRIRCIELSQGKCRFKIDTIVMENDAEEIAADPTLSFMYNVMNNDVIDGIMK